MNKRILAGLLVAALAATTAQAGPKHDRGHDHDHRRGNERARVVQVEPIFERVRYSVPVEHCRDERVRFSGSADRTGAAIAGGVVGAVIGNQIGDGRGAATVVGAIAGAAIGSELAGDARQVRHGHVRRCEVRHEARFEQRVVAYRVTYVHRGRRDVTRLAYDPGRHIELADVRRRG